MSNNNKSDVTSYSDILFEFVVPIFSYFSSDILSITFSNPFGHMAMNKEFIIEHGNFSSVLSSYYKSSTLSFIPEDKYIDTTEWYKDLDKLLYYSFFRIKFKLFFILHLLNICMFLFLIAGITYFRFYNKKAYITFIEKKHKKLLVEDVIQLPKIFENLKEANIKKLFLGYTLHLFIILFLFSVVSTIIVDLSVLNMQITYRSTAYSTIVFSAAVNIYVFFFYSVDLFISLAIILKSIITLEFERAKKDLVNYWVFDSFVVTNIELHMKLLLLYIFFLCIRYFIIPNSWPLLIYFSFQDMIKDLPKTSFDFTSARKYLREWLANRFKVWAMVSLIVFSKIVCFIVPIYLLISILATGLIRFSFSNIRYILYTYIL